MTASAEPAPRQSTPRERMPDFFIVGHHKSGTTALYEMLRRHPDIFMPGLKEPRFFAKDLRPLFGPNTAIPATREQYLALFEGARADQRTGEASPSYLRSRTAAREIAELQPDARIIAILREPASFVRSLHLQLVQDHVEAEQDLRKAIAQEDIVRAGERVLRYSDHVHYLEQVRRYHDVFAAERVLVLIYDDFRRDNEATVRRVLRFLDVDDTAPVRALDANPTVSVRSLRADRMLRSVQGGHGPLARGLRSTAKALLPGAARSDALSALRRRVLYSQPPPPDEDLMNDLRRRYRDEVAAVGEYLGRDLLTEWGYGGLA
jgi:hypothetical protein